MSNPDPFRRPVPAGRQLTHEPREIEWLTTEEMMIELARRGHSALLILRSKDKLDPDPDMDHLQLISTADITMAGTGEGNPEFMLAAAGVAVRKAREQGEL